MGAREATVLHTPGEAQKEGKRREHMESEVGKERKRSGRRGEEQRMEAIATPGG